MTKEFDEYLQKTDYLLSFQDIKDDLALTSWTINYIVSRNEHDRKDDVAIFKSLAQKAREKLDSTYAEIGKLSCELEQIPGRIKVLNKHAIDEANELRELSIKHRLLEKCIERLEKYNNREQND